MNTPVPFSIDTPPEAHDPLRAGFEREALVHLDVLFSVARRLSGSDADAGDIVQETLLRAYRAWGRFRPGSNAKAWLLTILRHTFINEYRRRSRRAETVDVETLDQTASLGDPAPADPEAAFFDRLVDDEVLRAVQALPPAFRRPLELSAFDQLRYEEIAAVLGVPVGTIKSRLFRARHILRKRLGDYAREQGYH